MEDKDLEFLKQYFDERYVKTITCADIQREAQKRFANDDKRISLLISKMEINNWLTLTIAAGIVALLIKVFLGG